MYHRVAAQPVDPWQLSVSPAHFDEHLQVLKRRGILLLCIRDLVVALKRRTVPRRFAVVTFDDGYADNLNCAKPLLERHGVPATVFVTSGWLGRPTPFWWDELQDLLLFSNSLPEVLRIDMPEGRREFSLGRETTSVEKVRELSRTWRASSGATPTRRHAAYLAIHSLLSSCEPSLCDRGMSQLRSQITHRHSAVAGSESGRPLSPEEVVELARGGLIEIGAHGLTHARLARLSAQDQRREIGESRRQLEEILKTPVTSFAYPFGGKQDFTAQTASIVQQEGFSGACAATSGTVRVDADLWRLERFHVVDSDGDQMDRRISRWFAA
jgi:peptidoglycan/xylan/chitin deacetylase (PgdA/CDA1 family)